MKIEFQTQSLFPCHLKLPENKLKAQMKMWNRKINYMKTIEIVVGIGKVWIIAYFMECDLQSSYRMHSGGVSRFDKVLSGCAVKCALSKMH